MPKSQKIRTYTDLSLINEYVDRFLYLQLNGVVGQETFACDRYLNQRFYKSGIWEKIRRDIILRDNGCDLGVPGFEIYGPIIVHHIEPITVEDIINMTAKVTDYDNLICCTDATHKAIHYGDTSLLMPTPIERRPGDTCPWKH